MYLITLLNGYSMFKCPSTYENLVTKLNYFSFAFKTIIDRCTTDDINYCVDSNKYCLSLYQSTSYKNFEILMESKNPFNTENSVNQAIVYFEQALDGKKNTASDAFHLNSCKYQLLVAKYISNENLETYLKHLLLETTIYKKETINLLDRYVSNYKDAAIGLRRNEIMTFRQYYVSLFKCDAKLLYFNNELIYDIEDIDNVIEFMVVAVKTNCYNIAKVYLDLPWSFKHWNLFIERIKSMGRLLILSKDVKMAIKSKLRLEFLKFNKNQVVALIVGLTKTEKMKLGFLLIDILYIWTSLGFSEYSLLSSLSINNRRTFLSRELVPLELRYIIANIHLFWNIKTLEQKQATVAFLMKNKLLWVNQFKMVKKYDKEISNDPNLTHLQELPFHLRNEIQSCQICFSDEEIFDINKHTKLECGHYFHTTCLRKWLDHSRLKKDVLKCPVCSFEIEL